MAHAMGADFLEQDVVATRDGALVVLHDIYLDRVTDVAAHYPGRARADGRYYVRDFDLDELRLLRAWERMNADGTAVYPDRYPVRSGDFGIATLTEEIEHIARLNRDSGRRAGIYPEIKRPAWHRAEGIDIAPRLIEILAAHGYADRDDPVFIQCFDAAEVRRLKEELECPWKLVQLIGDNAWAEAETDYDFLRTRAGLEQIAGYADAIGPWLPQLYAVGGKGAVTGPTNLVKQAHAVGLAVHPYTFRVDDLPPGFASFAELVRFCAFDLCVDGLFTDFPDKALESLQRK